MNRIARLLVSITALAVLASACGGADDEVAEAPSTTEAPVASDADGDGESAGTGDAPTTSAAPTTTEAPTTTTEAPTTTSSTTTTEAPDTDPPAAPTGLTCELGGGSGEAVLRWDAPADPADVETIKIYVNEDSAGFVRLHAYTQDELLSADSAEWMALAMPVPYTTPLEFAVTHSDANGNESGWYPIDAFLSFSGGCAT
jgi:hypothetical protein